MTGLLTTTPSKAVLTEANFTSVKTQRRRTASCYYLGKIHDTERNKSWEEMTRTTPRDRLKKEVGWANHNRGRMGNIMGHDYRREELIQVITTFYLGKHDSKVSISVQNSRMGKTKATKKEMSRWRTAIIHLTQANIYEVVSKLYREQGCTYRNDISLNNCRKFTDSFQEYTIQVSQRKYQKHYFIF